MPSTCLQCSLFIKVAFWKKATILSNISMKTRIIFFFKFRFDLFATHHVHRITHESLNIMTYFQCGPLMTCGGLEWEVESTTVTHSSADWWDHLLPLA